MVIGEEENYDVYKHTNTENGMSYIGQTTRSMEIRWKVHIRNAKNGSMLEFHKAIREYGIDAFTSKVLYKCKDLMELELWEGKYIQKYNTMVPNGYNMSHNTCGVSDETKENISEGLKKYYSENGHHLIGRKRTDKQKQKQSEWMRDAQSNGGFWLGKKHTKESKKKTSETMKKMWAKRKAKKIQNKNIELFFNMA